MTTEIISAIIGIGLGIIAAIIRVKSGNKPANNRSNRHYAPSDQENPFPCFDKDYRERQRRKEENIYF